MAAVRFLLFPLLLLLTLSTFPFSFPQSDNEALLKLRSSFTNAGALSKWDSKSSPCKDRWVGVLCTDGIITSLHLTDLGLSGKIDIEALGKIRGLRTISFVNNSFSGPIPEFNKLGSLKALYLSMNQFSGPIPTDYFSQLTSLKKVWLVGNKFSGTIPESLSLLHHLLELHLERNEFSGPIPPLKLDTVTSFDLSNNKLEGPIPESLSKFSASSFADNEGICGKPLNKDCNNPAEPAKAAGSSSVTMLLGLVIFIIVAGGLLARCRSAIQSRNDHLNFTVLEKEHEDDVVEVRVQSSNRRVESSKKGGNSKRSGSRRGSVKNSMGDLIMVNDEKGVFGLPDLMKAAAEVLGNGGLGSAYKAVMSNGLSVVVKRMREMNKMDRDGFDAEMRKFGSLRHRNILTPLAYHYRKEEKLLVSEHIPKGSLLYVLHGDRGITHGELTWPNRLKIVQGIARGLEFLHSEYASYDLPHGNLKSSNVLLSDDYEPLLSDFAFHPLTNPNNAVQAMFAYKSPDYVQYQHVSPKSDIYCLGIIILEILTGKFPSQYLSNNKGGTDVVHWVLTAISERREAEVIDPEIGSNTDSLKQMLQLLQIGAAFTESNPDQRLNMREVIRMIEEVQVF
ncbi:putative Receptor-like kinase [Quillaja saponaria]|uniref:Receptor-like kinase n=1 Tax=Quillaja saponaria TaxID=32244 RepID=A0AAD7VKK2_QUISA|nr:putative Receptor-like kinase [Quillaja saponaria]